MADTSEEELLDKVYTCTSQRNVMPTEHLRIVKGSLERKPQNLLLLMERCT